jgi:hypothetical protein
LPPSELFFAERKWTIDATLCAELSSPTGKMILTVSVLICFQLTEGGLPPNSCALRKEKLRTKNVKLKSLGICADLKRKLRKSLWKAAK